MTADHWTPAALLEPYPFSPQDPPTVEDFETALGVIDYSTRARTALGIGMRGRYYTTDAEPLNGAANVLRTVAPYLAVPNPPDDEEELPSTTTPDEPEEGTA